MISGNISLGVSPMPNGGLGLGPLGPSMHPSMPRVTSLENVHSLNVTRPPSTGIDSTSLASTVVGATTPYSPQRPLPSSTTWASQNGSFSAFVGSVGATAGGGATSGGGGGGRTAFSNTSFALIDPTLAANDAGGTRVFEELLDAEVFLNPVKLREAARQGIPSKYRGTVYRYLLGITSMDKSSELTFEQMQEDDFALLEQAHPESSGAPPSSSTAVGTASSSSSAMLPTSGRAITGSGGRSLLSMAANATAASSSLGVWTKKIPSSTPDGWFPRPNVTQDPYVVSPTIGVTAVGEWEAIRQRARQLPQCRADAKKRSGLESVLRALEITHAAPSALTLEPMSSSSWSEHIHRAQWTDDGSPSRYTTPGGMPTTLWEDPLHQNFHHSSSNSVASLLPRRAVDVELLFALLVPFDVLGLQPWESYNCVEALLSFLTSHGNVLESTESLRSQCELFMMILHYTNEDLYDHLRIEEVDMRAWLPQMLQTLLAGQLHIDDVLRLWDYYLAECSESGSFRLHLYVCLALLSVLTEELLEMDGPLIVACLQELPRVDPEMLLQKAFAIREDVLARDLL